RRRSGAVRQARRQGQETLTSRLIEGKPLAGHGVRMSLGTVLWPALLAGLAHTGLGQGHDARVPDPSEASYAHLSTALALDPCGSAYGSDWQDVDSQRAIEQARAQLPRDT